MSSVASGTWRLALHATRGTDFEGGHTTTQGLDPGGSVVSVPLHRHEVSLDFLRVELVGALGIADGVELVLRAPYDVKVRRAGITLVDPASPTEVAAMEANLAIHHPSATLEGFSDAQLLAALVEHGVIVDGDRVRFAVGSSLPIGRTRDDPYVAGDNGATHEHIQFGTGTFDPLLELAYSFPVAQGLQLGFTLATRTPVYENRRGYRGPFEGTSALRLDAELNERLMVRAGLSLFLQGRAEWNGVRDENTGLVSTGVIVGGSYRLAPGVVLSFDGLIPIAQETLDQESDAFEQGLVLLVGLSFAAGS